MFWPNTENDFNIGGLDNGGNDVNLGATQGTHSFPTMNNANFGSFPGDSSYNINFMRMSNQDFSSPVTPARLQSSPNPNGLMITVQAEILALQNAREELKKITEEQHAEMEAMKKEVDVLKNHIAEMREQITTTSTVTRTDSNSSSDNGGARKARNGALEKLIHTKAHAALGLQYRRGSTVTLPDPLGPDEEPRTDGDRILYNPIWTKDTHEPINAEFIDAVTTMVENHMKVDNSLESQRFEDIRPSVKNYFDTLAQNWKRQTDPKKKASAQAHRTSNKGYMRRLRDAESLTRVLPQFFDLYGAENCHGIQAIIDEGWLDGCFDDPGNAIPEEWKARADEAANGSKEVWEVRQQAWQAQNLRRILCRLFKLARENAATSGNNVPTPRFHCTKVNVSTGNPRKNIRPWKSFVRESWLKANPTFRVVDDDPKSTILSLEIPDSDFDEVDLKWLADDEACAEAALEK
ncbi:hypothetical protein K435DRAFT_858777 [Dendrothele bispora CBS 962.96]|uniref:Uncharacterized protein n=1 Tax=Dendrothele bispora (strain CBS 962.96) TaxID=1314807 RepID=A0A4S8M261_DENBC|nr:hypothetical protein K435DRAFT_858777 [Dendrothele bispora CBS 962.96]